MKSVLESFLKLHRYILHERYRGYDPFDVLTSPFFSLPLFGTNKLIRFGAQQLLKRSPVNVRPLLGVKKGYNPVTLGLCLQAYANVWGSNILDKYVLERESNFCLNELTRLVSQGYHGACWGYDFDWEARYAKIPAFTPTVVATGFITNALFSFYSATGNEEAFALCKSAADFVRNDLHKTFEGDTFCYSYSPLDKQMVFNATMKGVRLLAQVYSVTKQESLKEEMGKAARFVINHQQPSGAWYYSFGDKRTWVDNFHTAYVLDCLNEYNQCTGDSRFCENLKRGLDFYLRSFFGEYGIPRYYNNKTYPIDSTVAAESILILLRFDYINKAVQIAEWMIKNMQHPSGFFYYQKHQFWTNRISYMRWSNAWMFVALSSLVKII